VSIRKGEGVVRRDLFGGAGEVHVWNLLSAAAEPFAAVLSCELAAGGWVGRHVQEHYAEVVVGLSGSGQASVDGQARSLGPGDVVHVPLGATLAIDNRAGSGPLGYLIIKA
jgi:quercetin dioxygenase-like cupin family protein